MQKRIMSFMEEYHMAEEGDCILAAVSGGADSMCLLLMLLAIQQEKRYRLCVTHVEHGIRGEESRKDARFVEKFCNEKKIPCKIFCCQAEIYAREHKMTVEEGARKLRYEFLEQAAAEFGADKIAVAHNQNDCAETMLFHLARGCALKGLGSIPPVRGKIIRPLLCVDRKEIETYLAEKNQEFCSDKTNEELDYTRNKIRHQILPVLEEVNKQAVSHMNRTAYLAAEAAAFMEEISEQAKESNVFRKKEGIFILETLTGEKMVIQKHVSHKVLAEMAGSSRDISGIHICQFLDLFEKQVGKKLHLPYGIEAERTYGGIFLRKEIQEAALEVQECAEKVWILPCGGMVEISPFGYEIHTKIIEKNMQNEKIPKKKYTKWFDYDKIKGVMHLRTRREKDFFVIDSEGRRKKLKKYLVDEKVPRDEREHVLLLADDVHIIWAIGYRISEDVKVTGQTKRILEVQVCKTYKKDSFNRDASIIEEESQG